MDRHIFDALRTIIHDAILDDFLSEDGRLLDNRECEDENEDVLSITNTDSGLAIRIGDELFGITIEQV